jgi:protein phosphatase 1L
VFRRYGKEKNADTVRYGIAETKGLRQAMEDAHAIWDKQGLGFLSAEVYDGHAGSLAARMAAEKLTLRLVEDLRSRTTEDPLRLTAEALRDAYLAIDREIVESGTESGTAAATLYLQGERFLAANAGDCRIVIGEGRQTVELTRDHRPDLPEEMERIEGLGGRVVSLDMPRVQGMLAMSRALGDAPLKPFVTAEPRIGEGTLGRSNDLAVIACDGLWDVLTSEEAIITARKAGQPEKAAELLRETALARGSSDNITVIVVDLKHYVARCPDRHLRMLRVLDRASDTGFSLPT